MNTSENAYLLDGKSGRILGSESMLNPQYPYGADVISRIQAAENGELVLLGTGATVFYNMIRNQFLCRFHRYTVHHPTTKNL